MSNPSSVLYQMGEAVAAKVSLGKQQILSANNVWTGSSNTFNNNVSIGGNVNIGGSTALDTLSTLRAATIGGNLTVSGDLTVNGTTTTLSTSTLDVKDNFIRLSEGANAGAFTKDQGFYFERASGSDAGAFIFDESEDSFVVGTLAGTFTPSSVQIGDATNNVVLEFASGNAFTSLIIDPYTSGPGQNDFDKISTPILYFYSDSATLADIVTAAASDADITATLTGNDTTSVPIGTLSISAETTSGASDSTDDTVNATPAPLTVGSLKLGSQELGDLADFSAGLA